MARLAAIFDTYGSFLDLSLVEPSQLPQFAVEEVIQLFAMAHRARQMHHFTSFVVFSDSTEWFCEYEGVSFALGVKVSYEGAVLVATGVGIRPILATICFTFINESLEQFSLNLRNCFWGGEWSHRTRISDLLKIPGRVKCALVRFCGLVDLPKNDLNVSF